MSRVWCGLELSGARQLLGLRSPSPFPSWGLALTAGRRSPEFRQVVRNASTSFETFTAQRENLRRRSAPGGASKA